MQGKKHSCSGPLIQQKVRKVAENIGLENFTASNRWLESLPHRHNIGFKILSGESAEMSAALELRTGFSYQDNFESA